jgi:hypothetical protein
MSVDGVELEVPDTPANAARAGYRSAKGGHGPFPQFLVMALAPVRHPRRHRDHNPPVATPVGGAAP